MRRWILRRLAVGTVALAAPLFIVGQGLAVPGELAGTTMQATSFNPCNQPSGPPLIESCAVADRDPQVQATCDPAGTSTLSITRSGFVTGTYNGTYTETITATLGPQTAPAQPAFQPLPTSGIQAGTIGFNAGLIDSESFTASFQIDAYDGTTIVGTRTMVNDLANTGVCVEVDGEVPPSPVFTQPAYGYFYILNAQVLRYDATITPPAGSPVAVSGDAEAYLANTFAIGPPATDIYGTDPAIPVYSSQGHLVTGFGTTHPASGTTSPPVETPPGTDVVVTPAPGVTLTFGVVDVGGETSVTALATAPPLPAGFQAGDPPMYYEITTTATFSGEIRVCAPYGSPPAGTRPVLLHYENDVWTDVYTDHDDETRIVCGLVTSLSPFAAVFVPAAPTSTADCKGGGWKLFTSPSFKNQGDCVRYVKAQGKKSP